MNMCESKTDPQGLGGYMKEVVLSSKEKKRKNV